MESILSELLPRKVRLWLYVIVSLAGLALAAWQASDGNWLAFSAGLVQSLIGGLAARNINPPNQTQAPDGFDPVAWVQGTHVDENPLPTSGPSTNENTGTIL